MAPPQDLFPSVIVVFLNLIAFSSSVKSPPHTFLSPPRQTPQSQVELPAEIYEEIIKSLTHFLRALRQMGAACRMFKFMARPIAFQTVVVRSADHLVRLNPLLLSSRRTIPTDIHNLIIRFEHLHQLTRLQHDGATVMVALANVIDYFTVKESMLFNIPCVISRFLGWECLHDLHSIRVFHLHGTYTCVLDFIAVLSGMPLLETLVIDASFKNEISDALLTSPSWGSSLSSKLKELCLASPESLPLLHWISSVDEGPEDLHLLCIKVDNINRHRRLFGHIGSFLHKFGTHLSHLFVWFEGTWDEDDAIYPGM